MRRLMQNTEAVKSALSSTNALSTNSTLPMKDTRFFNSARAFKSVIDSSLMTCLLVALLVTLGCGGGDSLAASNNGSGEGGHSAGSDGQTIYLQGDEVAEVTEDGEVWIGGEKVGEFTSDGEIWVGGEKEGEITSDGEVWKAGSQVGEITDDGEVWHEGDQIGTVEEDGTIWIGSSREGQFEGGKARHAAIIVFYEFFELDN